MRTEIAETGAKKAKNTAVYPDRGSFGDIGPDSCGVKSLFRRLAALGVILSADADGLAIDAPGGVLGDDLVGLIRAHRDKLLVLVERFNERSAIMQYDGGLSRAEAERLALADLMGSLDRADDPAGEPEPLPLVVGWLCPWCRSGDRLADDPEGWRCLRCDRLAWRWVGDGIERCDWIEPRAVNPVDRPEPPKPSFTPEPVKKRPAVVDAAERSLFDAAAESG